MISHSKLLSKNSSMVNIELNFLKNVLYYNYNFIFLREYFCTIKLGPDMKRIITIFIFSIMVLDFGLLKAKDLEINSDFNILTSKNAQGYFKPLFTTIEESFNTGLFTTANYKNGWSISLDLGLTGMFIPNSQRTFEAELPESFGNTSITETSELIGNSIRRNHSGTVTQPTIMGGISNPVFSAPQDFNSLDSLQKTIAFLEGNDISFMTGLPIVQLSFGIPTRTQFKVRFATATISENSFSYYTLGVNQNIDKFFDLFGEDENAAIALNFAYHSLSWKPTIEMASWSLGAHGSYTFDNGFTFYGGMQYETFSGDFYAKREQTTKLVKSPYQEIRDQKPIAFSLESDNAFRLLGGLSYRWGILELHTDIAWAAQPVVKAGLSLWFLDTETPKVRYEGEPLQQFTPASILATLPRYTPESNFMALNLAETPKRSLNGKVEMTGVINGAEVTTDKIVIEEFMSRQMRPLLPYIFFEDNQSELPVRYNQISSAQASSFGIRDLLGKTNLETYYHTLNIIGLRMKNSPEAKITLTGYNSNLGKEKNNKNLSKARAEKIKEYFVNVWGIAAERIDVKFGNKPKVASNDKTVQGIEENRRVEISSDLWDVVAPIDIQDTLRTITPTTLRFKPEIQSDLALKGWSLDIKSDTGSVKTIAGLSKPNSSIDFGTEEYINKIRFSENLNYNLTLTNVGEDEFKSAAKSIPVEILSIEKKRKAMVKDTIYNKYNLILFDFNKSKLDPVNKRITDVIKSEVPADGLITVIGFTDSMGDEKHNQKLSASRAKSTTDALGRKDAVSIGKGENDLLFSNDLPEGRFLCRTVVVDVKIPVNN